MSRSGGHRAFPPTTVADAAGSTARPQGRAVVVIDGDERAISAILTERDISGSRGAPVGESTAKCPEWMPARRADTLAVNVELPRRVRDSRRARIPGTVPVVRRRPGL